MCTKRQKDGLSVGRQITRKTEECMSIWLEYYDDKSSAVQSEMLSLIKQLGNIRTGLK